MTIQDFTKAVNDIGKTQGEKSDQAHQTEEKLLDPDHTEYPEYLLKRYHEEGLTPEQTYQALEDEYQTELEAEARCS